MEGMYMIIVQHDNPTSADKHPGAKATQGKPLNSNQ